MPDPQLVTVLDPDGVPREISADALAPALARGFRLGGESDNVDRMIADSRAERYGGVGGGLVAFGAGTLRGLTGGASDLALRGLYGEQGGQDLAGLRAENPGLSTAGNIAGMVAPAILSMGGSVAARGAVEASALGAEGLLARESSALGSTIAGDLFGGASLGERALAASPAGLTTRLGSKISALGEGGGLAKQVAANAAAGAAEGAIQNAGAYVTDVALGDRELSADAFVGSMGEGAMWGGGAGGALTVSARGLTAARSLFPKQEVTRAVVQRAETEATQAVRTAVEDTESLAMAARRKMAEIREARAALDLTTKTELDALAIERAKEMAATARSNAEGAAARAERAKLGPAKRTRKAFQEPDAPVAAPKSEPVASVPKSNADFPEDGFVSTIPAKDIEARGFDWVEAPGFDVEKVRRGRETMATGQKDPIKVLVSPQGRLWIDDGRHRLAAAIESGKPVKVRWLHATDALDTGKPPMVGGGAGAVADDAGTLLERQLGAMKGAIDDGASLQALNAQRVKPTHVEDALNARVAKSDPDMAKLVTAVEEMEAGRDAMSSWLDRYGSGSQVSRLERSDRARAVADSWRPKEPGYVSHVPAGEGNALGARGREWRWQGSEAERAAKEERFYARQGGREALDAGTVRVYPEDLAMPPKPLDERIGEAMGARTKDFDGDVMESAHAVSRVEKAQADLVDILGPEAPAGATARAAEFRAAQKAADDGAAGAAAQVAADAEKAAKTIGIAPPKGRDLVGKVLQVGDGLEMLQMLGINVPDPGQIPVIGPVLKMVLRARIMGKTFGRFGGRVAETAETAIAKRAAAVKQRVYSAVDAMLAPVAKATSKAAPHAGGVTAVLAHRLFDDGTKAEPVPKGDVEAAFQARSKELILAMQPGAIEDAVRKSVAASDPELARAIAETQRRKLEYLHGELPKPSQPAGLLQEKPAWVPGSIEVRAFARKVDAVENPAGVLERVAAGKMVTQDEVTAVQTVYPSLYADAQRRLVEQAAVKDSRVPRARRIQLSMLFGIPLDRMMSPDYANFLQADYHPPQAPLTGQGQPPPSPTIAADVNLASRTDPSM